MACNETGGFSETARDHAERPRNHVPLQSFNGLAGITGPCGDTMEIRILVRHERIERASFITDGCGPSLACGSMVTELARGKTIEKALALRQEEILFALGGLPTEHEHCALLAVDTLHAACKDALEHTAEPSPANRRSPCDTCPDSSCSTSEKREGESDKDFEERRQLESRLCRIAHTIIVMSGKGGVGKSTIAVNIAVSLMLAGKRVGLLDADVHGPSIPTMLGLEGAEIQGGYDGMIPVELGTMKVMSVGFLLKNPHDAVIWRGPMKMGVIKQFLKDVDWGDLDYLIIDSPPGTGDEPLSVCQLIGKPDGAVIVTTPQKVAAVDVRKSVSFCRKLRLPVLGVVENMAGFACPRCGETSWILSSGGGKKISDDMHVPFLGSIPIDPRIAETCDSGRAFIHTYADTPTAGIMLGIVTPLLRLDVNTTINI